MTRKLLLLAAASAHDFASLGDQRQAEFRAWGVDLTAMDSASKPGDDFFEYVNGGWAKRTEIAPDRTFVGIDSVLNDQIDKDVRAIVEDTAKNPPVWQIGQQSAIFMPAGWTKRQSRRAAPRP
jgi:endothelin-converting enzyme/putative endopeptidase